MLLVIRRHGFASRRPDRRGSAATDRCSKAWSVSWRIVTRLVRPAKPRFALGRMEDSRGRSFALRGTRRLRSIRGLVGPPGDPGGSAPGEKKCPFWKPCSTSGGSNRAAATHRRILGIAGRGSFAPKLCRILVAAPVREPRIVANLAGLFHRYPEVVGPMVRHQSARRSNSRGGRQVWSPDGMKLVSAKVLQSGLADPVKKLGSVSRRSSVSARWAPGFAAVAIGLDQRIGLDQPGSADRGTGSVVRPDGGARSWRRLVGDAGRAEASPPRRPSPRLGAIARPPIPASRGFCLAIRSQSLGGPGGANAAGHGRARGFCLPTIWPRFWNTLRPRCGRRPFSA